jgi:hypothetical protein
MQALVSTSAVRRALRRETAFSLFHNPTMMLIAYHNKSGVLGFGGKR